MIQCSDCEHYHPGRGGQANFTCNPFTNIKEPECVQKWQLIKLDMLVRAQQQTAAVHERLEPLTEKMMSYMERELDELNEADAWKLAYDEEDEEDGEIDSRLP